MPREGKSSAGGSGFGAGENIGPNPFRMIFSHDPFPAVQALPASLPPAETRDDAVASFLAGLSAMSAPGTIPRSIYGAGAGEVGHEVPPPKPARAGFVASHAQSTTSSLYTRPVDAVAQTQEEIRTRSGQKPGDLQRLTAYHGISYNAHPSNPLEADQRYSIHEGWDRYSQPVGARYTADSNEFGNELQTAMSSAMSAAMSSWGAARGGLTGRGVGF